MCKEKRNKVQEKKLPWGSIWRFSFPTLAIPA